MFSCLNTKRSASILCWPCFWFLDSVSDFKTKMLAYARPSQSTSPDLASKVLAGASKEHQRHFAAWHKSWDRAPVNVTCSKACASEKCCCSALPVDPTAGLSWVQTVLPRHIWYFMIFQYISNDHRLDMLYTTAFLGGLKAVTVAKCSKLPHNTCMFFSSTKARLVPCVLFSWGPPKTCGGTDRS